MNELSERWAAAGAAFVAQRDNQGLSQADVARLSGVSDATIRKIEKGEPAQYRTPILRKLEKAVGWPAGHFNSLVKGKVTPSVPTNQERTEDPEVVKLRADVERLAKQVQKQALTLKALGVAVEGMQSARAAGQSQP